VSTPKAATTTSRGRTYELELPEGRKTLWSVTTLINGGCPKPALLPWGIKTTAEYAVANYRRLFAMCQAAEGDEDAIYQVVAWLKGAPYRDREAKADLGTLFHAVAEADALGKPRPAMAPNLAPLVAQFDRFRAERNPTFEMAEATVFNVRESYAGTLDAILSMGGKRYLVDYKTGKDIYPDSALQLVAYARAEAVYLAPGQVIPMPAIDGALVLHVTEETYLPIPVNVSEPVWRAFRFVREVFRWMEETSKGVLGEPLAAPAHSAKRPRRRTAA
jgi:hypothetical protein